MSPITPVRQFCVLLDTLLLRLELCQKDEARLLDQMDIGDFPAYTLLRIADL